MRHISRLASSLALTASLMGQVFIVDVNNGPGTNFTDLPTAAATVPDGATLVVRAGHYQPFTVWGMGLKVTGVAGVSLSCTLGASLVIAGTQPAQTTLLRNLEICTPIRLDNCLGAIVIDACRDSLLCPYSFLCPSRGITMTACSNVWLHACAFIGASFIFGASQCILATDSHLMVSYSDLRGEDMWGGGWFLRPGGSAVVATRSRCLFYVSTLRGGKGGEGCIGCLGGCPPTAGGPGGSALIGDSSTTVLGFASTLLGGDGGAGGYDQFCLSGCTPGGPGGTGIDSAGQAWVFGGRLAGGSGGGARSTCSAGAPGRPFMGGGRITLDSTAATTGGWVVGPQQRGQTILLTLSAPAGSPAVLLLSYRLDLQPIEPLAFGSLLAAPAIFVGPFSVGASRILQVPWTLPTALHLGEPYGGQFVSIDPATAQLRVSNPFPVLVDR